MADLDDFFAKKAKKKAKSGKKQYTTSTTIAKNVEAQQQAELLREQEKLQAPEKPARANPEDDKWRDFEDDEKPKDFSGLKIVELKRGTSQQDQKPESEEQQSEKPQTEEGDTQLVKPSEAAAGPWQISHEPSSSFSPSTEPVHAEKTVEKTEMTGKYRPGMFAAMRGGQSKPLTPVSTGGGGRWPGRKKKPPDVTSTEDFPSLQGALGAHEDPEPGDAFEKVEGGIRGANSRHLEQGPEIELGNKFGALDVGNS